MPFRGSKWPLGGLLEDSWGVGLGAVLAAPRAPSSDLEGPGRALGTVRRALGLWGQILDTFSMSCGSTGEPGAEGTGWFEGYNLVLGPGGEDYRRGEQYLAPAGWTAKHLSI